MNDKQFDALTESIAGLTLCQSLLAQFLVRNGNIKKEELDSVLRGTIEYFNKKYPGNSIVDPLKSMKKSINELSPVQFEDSLQDLMRQAEKKD